MELETLKKLLHLGVDKMVEDLEKELPEEETVTVSTLEKAAVKLKKTLEKNKQNLEKIKKTTWIVWMKSRRVIPDEFLSKNQLQNRRAYERKKAKETPEQREKRLEYMKKYHEKRKQQKLFDKIKNSKFYY